MRPDLKNFIDTIKMYIKILNEEMAILSSSQKRVKHELREAMSDGNQYSVALKTKEQRRGRMSLRNLNKAVFSLKVLIKRIYLNGGNEFKYESHPYPT